MFSEEVTYKKEQKKKKGFLEEALISLVHN